MFVPWSHVILITMPAARFAVTSEPLAVERLAAELEGAARAQGEGCGAVCTFLGIVRATHQGRVVRHLDYEAFEPLALKAFDRIREEIGREWPAALVAIHHRVGRLRVGEASVAIAAASAHRAQAFQACRYAIERVKQIAPIWKHEYFDAGDAWVEGATADIDDEDARRRALETACA
jgi:molybdopterin synthase catalytic subunit